MESSPLARLPAELRTNVYEFALTHSQPIKVPKRSARVDLTGTVTDIQAVRQIFAKRRDERNELLNLFALTQSSRQIHCESKHLFYATNAFIIRTYTMRDALHTLQTFTASIGTEAASSLPKLLVTTTEHTCICIHPAASHRMTNPCVYSNNALSSGRRTRRYLNEIHIWSVKHSRCQIVIGALMCCRCDLVLSLSELEGSLESAMEPSIACRAIFRRTPRMAGYSEYTKQKMGDKRLGRGLKLLEESKGREGPVSLYARGGGCEVAGVSGGQYALGDLPNLLYREPVTTTSERTRY